MSLREKIAIGIYDIVLEYQYGCKQKTINGDSAALSAWKSANPNIKKQLLGWADSILAAVAEWGNEICDSHRWSHPKTRKQCPYCWERLLRKED